MLYHLLVSLSDQFSALNVFRYLTFRTGGAIMTALLFVFMFGPGLISMLRLKQGRGQPIRLDGPQRHILEKQGTPTMGGLVILAGIVVATLLWADLTNLYVWAVLFVTLGFGAIGFYDDLLKVTNASGKGFSGRVRLLLEAVIAGMAAYIIMRIGDPEISSALALPFVKDLVIQLGLLFIPFAAADKATTMAVVDLEAPELHELEGRAVEQAHGPQEQPRDPASNQSEHQVPRGRAADQRGLAVEDQEGEQGQGEIAR